MVSYTSVSMTGTVATLLNRDSMIQSPATAGDTSMYIGYSYMDPETLSIVVFPTGTLLSVGTETVTVISIPASTTIETSTLLYDHAQYTPVLRLDYFDVSTAFPTLTAPCSIRVGMEEIQVSSIDYATNYYRCYIDSRGTASYPHTEWAPVVDAQYTVDTPATDSSVATYGVLENVEFHFGALDQNTLDLYAYEKLMDATNPVYGNVTLTDMDVWQNASYRHRKEVQYYVSTATKYATVSFHINATTGTDSTATVYLEDATFEKTWWDIRFATEEGIVSHYLATYGTQTATVWVKIKDPATGGATLSLYWGCPIAIDSTLSATPSGYTVATIGTWGSLVTGDYSIGDRGYVGVREGDLVDVVNLDSSTTTFRVAGMIYDQARGTLTMEIGKPDEDAITDLVKPFRTLDILSTKNL